MTHDRIVTRLLKIQQQIKQLEDEANSVTRGRWVEIISEFNGQMVGHSRPSLKGKRFKVVSCGVDRYWIYLFVGDFRYSVDLSGVRFLTTEVQHEN